MREYLTNVIMIALAGAFLVYFILILIHGSIMIEEPIIAIEVLEMVVFAAIIGFGLFNVTKLIRRK